MDIAARLQELLNEYGKLTKYQVSKNSDIPQSTLSTIFKKHSASIPTLENICSHLNITLSQFFFDPEKETLYPLTEEQRQMMEKWTALSPEQKKLTMDMIEYMNRIDPPKQPDEEPKEE